MLAREISRQIHKGDLQNSRKVKEAADIVILYSLRYTFYIRGVKTKAGRRLKSVLSKMWKAAAGGSCLLWILWFGAGSFCFRGA